MDTMKAGDVLNAGEQLTSANGRYNLVLQGDGNFVLYDGAAALWASDTWKVSALSKSMRAVLQPDGNLVLYSDSNRPSWASGTFGTHADRVVVQDDANVVIYAEDGQPLWSRHDPSQHIVNGTLPAGDWLEVGHELVSAHGQNRLVLQGDGNLVLYQGVAALWSTDTWKLPSFLKPTRAVMQGDGNFVLYSADNHAAWNSSSAGKSGDRLVVRDDANLVIYTANGVPVWARSSSVQTQPVHAHQRLEVGWGKFMESDATLYRNGNLQITAKTECNN